MQEELSNREKDPIRQLEISIKLAQDPDSVPLEEIVDAFYPEYSNHMVTLAGFSSESDGTVTGFWLNDTGGWTQITNRIFISTEKYNLMRENTIGFCVEFVKK